MAELRPCPFCGSNKIDLSIKTAKDYPFWYAAMYCKACHCYGARTRVTVQGGGWGWVGRWDIERSAETKMIAAEAWNRRAADEPVKHGRWDKNWDGDNIVYCDQCYIPQDMPTPYCPYCGARMDGEK